MREDAAIKSTRLLTCGRLTVEWLDASTIRAVVRGDSAELYRVGYEPGAGWTCDCAAFGRCSHLLALQRVTLVPTPRRWAEAVNDRCRCDSCNVGSTYYCVKIRSGLFNGHENGAGLTEFELFLIGMLPKAEPSAMALHLAAETRRNEREWARIQGIRWLVDVGQAERLEVVT